MPGRSRPRPRTRGARSAALLCALLVGCTPILRTRSAFGLGAFWEVESRAGQPVSSERFRGLGIVLLDGGVSIGWIRVERVEVDLLGAPWGTARVGETQLSWGRAAELRVERALLTLDERNPDGRSEDR